MNKKLQSELGQEFSILESPTGNNKLKIITAVGLTLFAAIIFFSNIDYEGKGKKMLANRKVPTFKFKKIIKKRSLRLNERIRNIF